MLVPEEHEEKGGTKFVAEGFFYLKGYNLYFFFFISFRCDLHRAQLLSEVPLLHSFKTYRKNGYTKEYADYKVSKMPYKRNTGKNQGGNEQIFLNTTSNSHG